MTGRQADGVAARSSATHSFLLLPFEGWWDAWLSAVLCMSNLIDCVISDWSIDGFNETLASVSGSH
jgi:hypothetical protein